MGHQSDTDDAVGSAYNRTYIVKSRKNANKTSPAWLPDGLFSNQKSQFGKILEGLEVEDVGIFYGHLKYFWTFEIFF
jgi:hypothetical protein